MSKTINNKPDCDRIMANVDKILSEKQSEKEVDRSKFDFFKRDD